MQPQTRTNPLLLLLIVVLLMLLLFVSYSMGSYPNFPNPTVLTFQEMTAQSVYATNTKVRAQIYATQTAKAHTGTPDPALTTVMATHLADNTRAYATQTAILAQFDATRTP
jgi:hypothetical protein